MQLKQLLTLLYNVSLKEGDPTPMLVGGVVRDKVLGNLKQSFNDVDITTGSNTQVLAKAFGIELGKLIPLTTKQANDGHISIYLRDLKIDFSSNFMVPGIEKILYQMGIKAPTLLQKETYSRDFHCNALLMSLDFRKVKDLTGEGVKDIKNKIIKTCLSPDLTFKYNTNRIIRVVYLAAKLGFNVDPVVIEWVKNNPKYITQSETSYLSKNIEKALFYDADKTFYLLEKMNMWDYIPITQKLYPYYAKRSSKELVHVKR